jgi:hypothetical protein
VTGGGKTLSLPPNLSRSAKPASHFGRNGRPPLPASQPCSETKQRAIVHEPHSTASSLRKNTPFRALYQSRQLVRSDHRGGHFWTPIPPLTGSNLHAETHHRNAPPIFQQRRYGNRANVGFSGSRRPLDGQHRTIEIGDGGHCLAYEIALWINNGGAYPFADKARDGSGEEFLSRGIAIRALRNSANYCLKGIGQNLHGNGPLRNDV